MRLLAAEPNQADTVSAEYSLFHGVMIMRLRHLAMRLSQLLTIQNAKPKLEQYPTEGQLAARWLGLLAMDDSLIGANVVDLGAGAGILGLGCAYLGAKSVTLIEADPESAAIAEENAILVRSETNCEVAVICEKIQGRLPEGIKADVIIMNPPWGFQTKGADRPIIEAALASSAKVIHLLHIKKATHIEGMANAANWQAEKEFSCIFSLPPSMQHHKKKSSTTRCQVWKITPKS
jgi:predicted RNA methylase